MSECQKTHSVFILMEVHTELIVGLDVRIALQHCRETVGLPCGCVQMCVCVCVCFIVCYCVL